MLDVRESPELQAAALALARASSIVRNDILKDARQATRADWQGALNRRAGSLLEQRVLVRGARVGVTARQVSLKAATSSRPLSGGLVPSARTNGWPGVEFGARTRRKTFTQRSRRGRAYQVTKVINRGLPARQANGRVVFDAASEVGTKLVATMVRTVVDGFRSFADHITPR